MTSKTIDYVDVSSPPEETYISDPPGGKIPYQPWAKAVRKLSIERGWREDGRAKRGGCIQTLRPSVFTAVPRATYRGGFEIVQVPGYVVILYGFGHYYRFIPTDGRPHEGRRRTSSCGWATPGAPGKAIRSSST